MSTVHPVITRLRFRRPVVTDTQITHVTVLNALPDPHGRVLWAAPTRDLLIVQAATALDGPMRDVVERTHGTASTNWTAGDPIRLSLIANPVRAAHSAPGQRGKRTPLPFTECEAWLRRKLADAAALNLVEVEEMGTRAGRRHDTRVTHRLVGFAAAGTVTDPARLRDLVLSGVGPGKAYGAGLLLVVRA